MSINLRGQEALILIQLRTGSWTTTDLAEHFQMQETNVSRELARLRKKGLAVSRSENPKDKRVRQHYMTQAGRDFLERTYRQ